MKQKAFTLIELLVVLAIIGILTVVGVTAFNGYTKKAMDSVIRSNHYAIKGVIEADLAVCMLNGGGNSKIERFQGATYSVKSSCRNAFNNGLVQHVLRLGLKDPFIVNWETFQGWVRAGRYVQDASAAWFGPPKKEPAYHPYYYVGKTFLSNRQGSAACDYDSNKHSSNYRAIELKTYLTNETTLISNCVDLSLLYN